MKQFGLLDYHKRLCRIDISGGLLVELNNVVNWEQFRVLIYRALEKTLKSPAGAKGYDQILLFNILILQFLYNLSDEAMEYKILDLFSFLRLLGIHKGSKIPMPGPSFAYGMN